MATTLRPCVLLASAPNDDDSPIHRSLLADIRATNGPPPRATSAFSSPSANPPLR